MPNWCKGTLKVRGTVGNIKRFIQEGLQPVNLLGENLGKLEENNYGDITYKGYCYIKNTRRGFVKDVYAYFDDLENNEILILTFDSKFAWCIFAEQLLSICKKYTVDMKIYAFERGMELNQNIEIVNGIIVKDDVIKFDDYLWECICPTLGG